MIEDYEIVTVTWEDSCSYTGWTRLDAVTGPAQCQTTGYLVHDTPHFLGLAGSVDHEGRVGDVMVIPASVVLSRTPRGRSRD